VRTARTLLAVALLVNGPPGAAVAQELKIASLAPDGTTWMKEMRAAGEVLAKSTSGRVQLKFYPGGVMGNDATVLRKLQIGQLHGGAITMLALARVYPDSQLYGLPMLFRSYAEVDYVRTRMDPTILAGLDQHSLVAFGLVEGGFAYLMSNGPVRRIADLRGEKVWAPEGDAITRTLFEVAAIPPVVLPLADVYTGLQTGLVTAVGVSPAGAIALQWHAKTKYFTDVPVFYTAGALVLDKRSFARLAPEDQAATRATLTSVFQRLDRASRKDDEAARAALKSHGIQFVTLGPEDSRELERLAAEARVEIGRKGLYTPGLLQALEGHLRDFRTKGNAAAGGR
jgi:TRAP-type C4-dicarboxylate transport system substrate-binding protein